MSRYPESQQVRKPVVAGTFYPATAKEINAMIGHWLHPAADGPAPQVVIVPHAGYVFSGEVGESRYGCSVSFISRLTRHNYRSYR